MTNKIKKATKIFFTLALIIFGIFALTVSPLILAFGKTGKNTTVLGRDYSILKKPEIEKKLAADFPAPLSLNIQSDRQVFTLTPASINFEYDYSTTASNLLYRRLHSGLLPYFRAFLQPKNFSLEIKYSPDLLNNFVGGIASQLDKPFVPSELKLENGQVVYQPGTTGQKVDTEALKNDIISTLISYQIQNPVQVNLSPQGNLPSQIAIDSAINTASKFVGRSLELSAPDQNVVIDDKTLISWIDFESLCRRGAVGDYVTGLSGSLKKNPVEAVFRFENGKVLEFRPSTNGYSLDTGKTEELICSKLAEISASSEKITKADFPVMILEALTENSDVNNMGIKELLGRGTSTFRHSSAIRNMNVERGASVVNNVLVAPGETFSFVKALGDVSIENGYKMAYVIRAGKTELDVGGGICQVSTTFFRAILNAGLDITERRNHAYRVQYYEEDMPPGYDATVFIPSPDLKFQNDTGHHLLIQSSYNGKEKRLTYEIYGTSDGRTTEISNYRQWGYTSPPPDVYIDDPSLPPGKVIQDERRIPGLKTSFDWKVTRNGEIIHQKTFTSNYVPWAAVYRRGPTSAP